MKKYNEKRIPYEKETIAEKLRPAFAKYAKMSVSFQKLSIKNQEL